MPTRAHGIYTGMSLSGMLRRHWLLLAVGYFFAFVDPFGINSKASQAISDAFDRMFSPVYTADFASKADSETGDLVDVILIDDLSIQTLSHEQNGYLRANDWPLAYSDHAIVIDALRRLGYGVVILDITFYRARQLDDSFQALVTRLKYFRDHAGLKVILGAGANPGQLEPSIQPLVKAASGVGLVGWSGYGSDYPIKRKLAGGQIASTLAVSGYEAYCHNTGWARCADLSSIDDTWFVPAHSGMHISWGMPAYRMSSSLDCNAGLPDPGWQDTIGYWLRNLFIEMTVTSEGQRDCPPVPTATLQDVFCTGPHCDGFFSDKHLENRIAIVGVSLPSARDLFDPPLPGLLPGVYLHAEALRNLLHYGSDYLKPLGFEWNLVSLGLAGWSVPADLILAWPLTLWGVLILARRVLDWRWENQSRSEWPELALEVVEIAIVIVCFCLVYSLALSFHRSPGFLAELIGLMPLLLIAIRKERKEMENEKKAAVLAACASMQFGIGTNTDH